MEALQDVVAPDPTPTGFLSQLLPEEEQQDLVPQLA